MGRDTGLSGTTYALIRTLPQDGVGSFVAHRRPIRSLGCKFGPFIKQPTAIGLRGAAWSECIMNEPKPTIGRAIDGIVEVLRAFEERDQRTILRTVCSHLELSLGANPFPAITESPSPSIIGLPPPPTDAGDASRPSLDIRALKDQKKPSSARQMACLVAYYLHEHAPKEDRKESITSADIEKYFKQAGYKLPEKLEQLLADSKRSGYFESSSRGAYKLTRVGYNLVAHSLPAKGQG
jgi:hypothetical protein